MEYKVKGKVRLIELFAGIGSQAMALRNIGVDYEHHKVIEFDKKAIESYNLIHNTQFEATDIMEITGKDLEIVDINNYDYIMTYSFPCTDLSLAGKMDGMSKGTNTRSGLLWEVERLLNNVENLPQILLMENVVQVVSDKNKKDFDKWVKFLEDKGYNNFYSNMNSKDYGLPQNRNRTFMVSILGDYNYEFPEKKELQIGIEDLLLPLDLIDKKHYTPDKIKEKVLRFLEQRGVRGYKPEKGNCYDNIVVGSTQKNALLGTVKGVSPTLTSSMGTGGGHVPMIIHNEMMGIQMSLTKEENVSEVKLEPTEVIMRRLIPLECWKIMGFSEKDYYKLDGKISNTQIYKQIGNSITVPVLEEIFRKLI